MEEMKYEKNKLQKSVWSDRIRPIVFPGSYTDGCLSTYVGMDTHFARAESETGSCRMGEIPETLHT